MIRLLFQGTVDAPASTLVDWLFEGIEEHPSWNKLVMDSVKLQVSIRVSSPFLLAPNYIDENHLSSRTSTKTRTSSTSRRVRKAADSLLPEISLFCGIATNAAIITSAVACPSPRRRYRIASTWLGEKIDRDERQEGDRETSSNFLLQGARTVWAVGQRRNCPTRTATSVASPGS